MYSLLIAFWANLCNKHMVVFSWLGGRMKKMFIGWTLVLFAIFTGFSILERLVIEKKIFILIMNIFGGILFLIVTIATLVEGRKVRKVLIESTKKREKTKKDRKVKLPKVFTIIYDYTFRSQHLTYRLLTGLLAAPYDNITDFIYFHWVYLLLYSGCDFNCFPSIHETIQYIPINSTCLPSS
jgi:hypothetical protein